MTDSPAPSPDPGRARRALAGQHPHPRPLARPRQGTGLAEAERPGPLPRGGRARLRAAASPQDLRAGGAGRKRGRHQPTARPRGGQRPPRRRWRPRPSAMPRSGSSTTATCRCRSCPARSGRRSGAGRRCRSTRRRSRTGRRQFPGHGIGLRTGTLVGVDIDILDPDLAHQHRASWRGRGSATRWCGSGSGRSGCCSTGPRHPSRRWRAGGVEVLGLGQQFVAFGIHPTTGRPYDWPLGETPLDVPLDALPLVDAGGCAGLLGEIASLLPAADRANSGARAEICRPASTDATDSGPAQVHAGPQRDASGRVVDGRDGWLSTIAYHAVHDAAGRLDAARDRRGGLGALRRHRRSRPAGRARHAATRSPTPSGRSPTSSGSSPRDRLPPREMPAVEADLPGADPLGQPRPAHALEALLADACDRIEAWHAEPETPRAADRDQGHRRARQERQRPPRSCSRCAARLLAAGGPSRLLVLTPSHALAEEAAGGMARRRGERRRAARLRGDRPAHADADVPRRPGGQGGDRRAARACTRPPAPAAAAAAPSSTAACKQRNRAEVAAADVVVAAHQALFTGFAVDGRVDRGDPDRRGLLGQRHPRAGRHRRRAASPTSCSAIGSGDAMRTTPSPTCTRCAAEPREAFADGGPVARSRLLAAGLDAASCRLAASARGAAAARAAALSGHAGRGRARGRRRRRRGERPHPRLHRALAGDGRPRGRDRRARRPAVRPLDRQEPDARSS